MTKARKRFKQIAPECYELSRTTATETIDIYSLGYTMLNLLKDHQPLPEIFLLAVACQNQCPEDRPTLDFLKAELLSLRTYILNKKAHRAYGDDCGKGIKNFILQQLVRPNDGLLPLTQWNNYSKVLEVMLEAVVITPGANRTLLLHPNIDGWNLIMLAVRYHHRVVDPVFDTLNELERSEKEAIFRQVNADGWNLLMTAIIYYPEKIDDLLQMIKLCSPQTIESVFRQTNTKGYSVFSLANSHSKSAMAALLKFATAYPAALNEKELLTYPVLDTALQSYPEAVPGVLAHLQTLFRSNITSGKNCLYKIPFIKFKDADQLFIFWELVARCDLVISLALDFGLK